MAFLKEKFHELQKEIAKACANSGRKTEEISVLAATKYAHTDAINEAIRAGIQMIGENRIQDAKRKFPELERVKKFFIGHLQTNKVKEAVNLFDGIESIDSLRLAEAVNLEAGTAVKMMPVLVEINIAADPKKFGVRPEEVEDLLRAMKVMKYLEMRGFMTIVPYFENVEGARPFFKTMKELFTRFQKEFRNFDTLSMGMSHDFTVAIEEGATEIRIGSYIFDLL